MKKNVILSLVVIMTLVALLVASNNVVDLTDFLKVEIVSPVESNGGIRVNLQDQTTPPVDFFFSQINGVPTTLAENTTLDDSTINITSAANCGVGDYVGIFSAEDPDDNRATFATILGASGTIMTLDTPIDFNFTAGNTVACFNRNINVDGSSTMQIFQVEVGSAANQCIDITRLMFSMITDSEVSLVEFGDIPALTNGLVIRRVDGDSRNFWNIKNNGELANLCFDYDPFLATNPVQGQDGAKFRCTFAGQDKHGVAVRLCPGDKLQALVQDDLQALNQFRIIAQGHYVTD